MNEPTRDVSAIDVTAKAKGAPPDDNRRKLALGGGKYILASRLRAGDEVTTDVLARPGRFKQVRDNLRVKEVYDGKWVITTNDDTLTPEDLALGYKQLMRVEQCWRQLKSGLRMRPVFHYRPGRIQAHVTIAVMALLIERIAEIRGDDTWHNLADQLDRIKVVEYEHNGTRVRQTSELDRDLTALLGKLGVPAPPKLHAVAAATPA